MPSWKKVIISGSNAALNSLNVSTSLTASGLIYPTIDGTSGQVVITDGAGNLTFSNVENTTISIKNVSGVTIQKGTPCYITGSGTAGNLAGVWPADASNPLRMPAGVIAGETLNNGDEGVGLLNGFINGVNTSTFNAGDSVYVAVGGGYTNVKPTGSSVLIQKLGNVEKSAINGSGVINGPAYYNEVPNIQQGFTWVGNSNGVAVAVATSSIQNVISSSFASTASFLNSSTNAFLQNGNSFGTTALLGTNDNQPLAFETNGSTRMFISSSGNVGIGTTSPNAKLDVNGNAIITGSLTTTAATYVGGNLSVGTTYNGFAANIAGTVYVIGGNTYVNDGYGHVNASAGTTGFFPYSNKNVEINSNSVTAIFVTGSNQNVGIGTTSPGAKLEVNGAGIFRDRLTISADAGNEQFVIQRASNTDSQLIFGYHSDGYGRIQAVQQGVGYTPLVMQKDGGNVGIGTTSPSTKLHVVSSENANWTTTFENTGSQGHQVYTGYNNGTLRYGLYISGGAGNSTSYDLLVGSDKLLVRGDGNVGIGTTSPSAKLQVIGTAGKLYIDDSGVGYNYYDASNAHNFRDFSGASKMYINTSTGNIGIGTTSPDYPLHVSASASGTSIYATGDIVAFSDQSVKENIRPIENVIERIGDSRGVLYDRIDNSEKDNIGFIAQELEVAFPELVVTNSDGTKAVKYQNAVAILFEAIKEQQKQINGILKLLDK
jgi:hypothetical protein